MPQAFRGASDLLYAMLAQREIKYRIVGLFHQTRSLSFEHVDLLQVQVTFENTILQGFTIVLQQASNPTPCAILFYVITYNHNHVSANGFRREKVQEPVSASLMRRS